MTETDTILAAIERRIAEANSEIESLIVARAALATNGDKAATPARKRNPRARAARPAASQTSATDVDAETSTPTMAESAAASPPAAREKRTTPATSRRRASRPGTAGAPAGKLEVLLADMDGVSAAALARRAGGSAAQVLALLRDLEQAGEVRRSGNGRWTRWHWITDEHRVKARAAELEAQFAATGQKRSRAPRRRPR
jgi:predicted Rossmann fold nucleotide-binding protein DprA/Smf involved in DNA uptake